MKSYRKIVIGLLLGIMIGAVESGTAQEAHYASMDNNSIVVKNGANRIVLFLNRDISVIEDNGIYLTVPSIKDGNRYKFKDKMTLYAVKGE